MTFHGHHYGQWVALLAILKSPQADAILHHLVPEAKLPDRLNELGARAAADIAAARAAHEESSVFAQFLAELEQDLSKDEAGQVELARAAVESMATMESAAGILFATIVDSMGQRFTEHLPAWAAASVSSACEERRRLRESFGIDEPEQDWEVYVAQELDWEAAEAILGALDQLPRADAERAMSHITEEALGLGVPSDVVKSIGSHRPPTGDF